MYAILYFIMKTLNIVSCFRDIRTYIILGILKSCVIVFCNESYVLLPTTSMKQNNSVEKVDTSTKYVDAHQVNANSFRRQGHGNERPRGAPLPPSLAKRIINKGKKYESQYLPYYPGGEWVYYRNASTNFPRPNIILNDTEPAYRDCNQICIKAYLNYGQICAKRLNRHDWVYEYKEFDDICQMELENCRSVGKRYDWYPLRQGPCATTDFPIQPSDGDAALKRLEEWEKRFLENPANDHVNPFIITTTTMPTAKPKKTPKER